MRRLLALAGLTCLAGCGGDVATGRAAYIGHCVDCHGTSARGDGRLAGLGNGRAVPDLTGLSARWGGSFPEAYVVRAIDTPGEVHRRVARMPDFGDLLAGRPVVYELPGGDRVATTDTVLALTAYLATLQQ